MPKERVGFIFECGRGGPDHQVAKEFLGRLNSGIEMVPQFMANAEDLLNRCGEVAALLLKEEKCSRVVVMWDLEPSWEEKGKPCRREDCMRAIQSLESAKVPLKSATLLCVERELECWLMADARALKYVLGRFKAPHPLGKIPTYKRPDKEIKRPKTELIKLFQRELGKNRKYLDREQAIMFARAVPDWDQLKRSPSFCRFAERAAGVKL